jgi:phosphatidylinositol alpha-1,6-mannosyltransferase
MARRHVELCRRLVPDAVTVSTVAADDPAHGAAFDAGEPYAIARQPFGVRGAKTITNAARWAGWLVRRIASEGADVLHCGNVRPAGYAVWWAARRSGVPYVIYVYGGDLLRERAKAERSAVKRWTAQRLFEESAGIVAISDWSAALARDIMREVGVRRAPPGVGVPLGTDRAFFHPARDTGVLRRRWGIGDAPLLLTVARLVPHKGQDIALRSLANLAPEFPTLRYVVVGTGEDAARLRALAAELGVADRVVWAGALTDEETAEAYATATVYVGLSRVDREINAEGFGISFVEAAASGVPSVAGDSGGVPSAVRDAETGILVAPTDVGAVVAALRSLLTDATGRERLGRAARRAVETYYNWDRVAAETRAFVTDVTCGRRGAV